LFTIPRDITKLFDQVVIFQGTEKPGHPRPMRYGFLFHGYSLYSLKEDIGFPYPRKGPVATGGRRRNIDPKLGGIAGCKIIIQALSREELPPGESGAVTAEISRVKSPGKSPHIRFIGPVGLIRKAVHRWPLEKVLLTAHQIDHA